MKISKLYGMNARNKSGKKRGVILAVSCRGDGIDGYICCNQCENEFFAEGEGALFDSEGALFLRTGREREGAYRLKLGRPAYDEGGRFLGYLADCTFKGTRLVKAKVGKAHYAFTDLIIGDVIIVKSGQPAAERAAKDMFIAAVCGDGE